MKRMQFLSIGLIALIAIIISSCGVSRPYYSYSQPIARPHSYVSLIINADGGYVMNRYSDGSYYYRTPQGYSYRRGYDNRLYLERSYINRINYDKREYKEWKRYDDHDRDDRHRRHY